MENLLLAEAEAFEVLFVGLPGTGEPDQRPFQPTTVPLEGGGFAIVWLVGNPINASSYGGHLLRAQLYSAAGAEVGDPIDVSTPSNQPIGAWSAIGLADGGLAVTWSQTGDVHVRLVSSLGAPSGDAFVANTTTAQLQELPDVFSLGDGFVVTWRDGVTVNNSASDVLRAQIFNGTGAKVGGEIEVTGSATTYQHHPTGTELSNGNFVIVWFDSTFGLNAPFGTMQHRAQLFDANGTKIGGDVVLAGPVTSTSEPLEVTALAGGGFVAAYYGNTLRIYDASAQPVGDPIVIAGTQLSVSAFDSGAFAVGFRGGTSETSSYYYIQLYDPAGIPIGESEMVDPRSLDATVYSFGDLSVAALANGDIVANWRTERASGESAVVAQLIDGPEMGTPGADSFAGGSGADRYLGMAGDDMVAGGSGADSLLGGSGNDQINGGDNDDRLTGNAGNDTLDGGAGIDTAVFSGASSAYSWLLVDDETHIEGTDDADTLVAMERMEFADATYAFGPTGEFAAPLLLTASFGAGALAGGWGSQRTYPRTLADIDGDGLADVIGFGDGGVYAALADGNGFGAAFLAFGGYGAGASAGGWSDNQVYPRTLADVNGDGMDDLVGFGDGGVFVSLAVGGGSFESAFHAFGGFGAGASAGCWSDTRTYPRLLADVNGDGMDDLVGFGDGGVHVSLAVGGGSFAQAFLGTAGFGAGAAAGGWSDDDVYTRTLADVNGDGRADIVGFGSGGVHIALANGDGTFAAPSLAFAGFGAEPAAGGWTSNNTYYRTVGDLNGDGNADLVGFGDGGVYAAYGDGTGQFAAAELVLAGFGAGASAGGWTSQDLYPRLLADLKGDGADDIVGFGDGGVIAATSVSDWVLV